MKSRKIVLIVFVAIASTMGLAALQDNIFVENQFVAENEFVDVNEFSSDAKTITVDISDGVGLGLNG
jgi:hypothetical protein